MKFERVEDRRLEPRRARAIRHAVDFGQHEAGDGVVVVGGLAAGGSTAAAGIGEQPVGLLATQDEIDGLFELAPVRTFAGHVSLRQERHDGEAGGGGLRAVRGIDRAIAFLLPREPGQRAVNRCLDLLPLIGRKSARERFRFRARGRRPRLGGEKHCDRRHPQENCALHFGAWLVESEMILK